MKKEYVTLEQLKILKAEENLQKCIEIRGLNTVGLPIWIINHYIKSTCDNYNKLIYLIKIIGLYSDEEIKLIDIGISTTSVPIDKDGIEFEETVIETVLYPNEKNKIEIKWLNDNPEDFWKSFRNCERPVCVAKMENGEIVFLHNPRGPEGIKICDVSYHSPIDISFSGSTGIISDLVNAGSIVRNDLRMQDEHEARMITQNLLTMQESINVLDKLNNSNLPGSHKEYILQNFNALMDKQNKLNKKLGITSPGYDHRI